MDFQLKFSDAQFTPTSWDSQGSLKFTRQVYNQYPYCFLMFQKQHQIIQGISEQYVLSDDLTSVLSYLLQRKYVIFFDNEFVMSDVNQLTAEEFENRPSAIIYRSEVSHIEHVKATYSMYRHVNRNFDCHMLVSLFYYLKNNSNNQKYMQDILESDDMYFNENFAKYPESYMFTDRRMIMQLDPSLFTFLSNIFMNFICFNDTPMLLYGGCLYPIQSNNFYKILYHFIINNEFTSHKVQSVEVRGLQYDLPSHDYYVQHSVHNIVTNVKEQDEKGMNWSKDYTFHKIKKDQFKHIINVDDGKLILVPDGFCLLNSVMNLTDFNFINKNEMAKMLFEGFLMRNAAEKHLVGIHGLVNRQQLVDILSGLRYPIQDSNSTISRSSLVYTNEDGNTSHIMPFINKQHLYYIPYYIIVSCEWNVSEIDYLIKYSKKLKQIGLDELANDIINSLQCPERQFSNREKLQEQINNNAGALEVTLKDKKKFKKSKAKNIPLAEIFKKNGYNSIPVYDQISSIPLKDDQRHLLNTPQIIVEFKHVQCDMLEGKTLLLKDNNMKLWKQVMFGVRKSLDYVSECFTLLPKYHKLDSQVLLYVHKLMKGYCCQMPSYIIKIQSQFQFYCMASLRKKNYKNYWPIQIERKVYEEIPNLYYGGSSQSYSVNTQLISKIPRQQLGDSLIASIHSINNSRAPQVRRAHRNKLHVIGQNSHTNIVANPSGPISPDLITALHKFGYPLSNDMIQTTNNGCGGHANLRFAQDLGQAMCLNRMFGNIFTNTDSNAFVDYVNPHCHNIVDFGAKYGSNVRIVKNYLENYYKIPRHLDLTEEGVKPAGYDDVVNVNIPQAPVDGIAQPPIVRREHSQARIDFDAKVEAWREQLNHRCIRYTPVRPNFTPYDQTYHLENEQWYNEIRLNHGVPGLQLMPIQKMTIQEYQLRQLNLHLTKPLWTRIYQDILMERGVDIFGLHGEQPIQVYVQQYLDRCGYTDQLLAQFHPLNTANISANDLATAEKYYYDLLSRQKTANPQHPRDLIENNIRAVRQPSQLINDYFNGLNHIIKGCDIDEVVQCQVRHHYYISDVHYYLAGWKPLFSGFLYCSGGLFYPVPGIYDLPFREGSYMIKSSYDFNSGFDTKVVMMTQGNSCKYEHDLVNVKEPTSIQHYGWYSHFQLIQYQKNTDPSPFEKIVTPPITCSQHTIQGKFLFNFYASKVTLSLQSLNDDFKYYSQYNKFDVNQKIDLVSVKENVLRIARKQWYRWSEICGFETFNSQSIQQTLDFLVYQRKKMETQSFGFGDFNSKNRVQENEVQRSSINLKLRNWRQCFIPSISYDTNKVSDAINDAAMFGCTKKYIQQYALDNSNKIDVYDKKQIKTMFHNQQFVNQKKKKIQSQLNNMANQINYYFAKPITIQDIKGYDDINPLVVQEKYRDNWNNNKQLIQQWLISNPTPVQSTYNRNKVTQQLQPLQQSSLCIKTGFDVIMDNGDKQIEYEWSSKCIQNKIFALHNRQFAAGMQIDGGTLNDFTTMMQRFTTWFEIQLDRLDCEGELQYMEQCDPFDWIDSKTDFSQAKKEKYKCTMQSQMNGLNNEFIGTFDTMVKSGEVYSDFAMNFDDNGFLMNKSDRPRNICVPSPTGCGLLTFLQSLIWQPLQKILPNFIQGLTKDQLTKRFKDNMYNIQRHGKLKVISLDGAAYDSSQFKVLMERVDDVFLRIFMDKIFKKLENNSSFAKVDISQLKTNLMKSLTNHSNTLFMYVPNINGQDWPLDIQKQWNRDWSVDKGSYSPSVCHNYIYYQLDGLTFSGDPVHTTLGNTLRSICYAFYYMYLCGIQSPWLQQCRQSDGSVMNGQLCWVGVSGDDTCIICVENMSQHLSDIINQITSRKKQPHIINDVLISVIGLGQIIETVYIGDIDSLDFCSKWVFCNGDVDSFVFYRDVSKVLLTKQYYVKKNQTIKNFPYIHSLAMLEGFKTEHVSKLMEDLFAVRFHYIKSLTNNIESNIQIESQELQQYNDRLKFLFSGEEDNYQYESQVNQKLGLTQYKLFQLISSFNYYYGCQSNTDEHIQNIFKIQINMIQKEKKKRIRNNKGDITRAMKSASVFQATAEKQQKYPTAQIALKAASEDSVELASEWQDIVKQLKRPQSVMQLRMKLATGFVDKIIQQYQVETGKVFTPQEVNYAYLALYSDKFLSTLVQYAKKGIQFAAPYLLKFAQQQLFGQVTNKVTGYSPKAIASFICPEDYWFRMPQSNGFGQKTGVYHKMTEYNLTTSSASSLNNGAWLVFPYGVAAASFISNCASATTNNVTGYDSGYVNVAGPMNGSSVARSWKLVSLSVEYISSQGVGTTASAGTVFTSYSQEWNNPNATNVGYFPTLGDMPSQSFKNNGPLLQRQRMIHIPDYIQNWCNTGVPTADGNCPFFCIMAQGSITSNAIGRIQISSVVEFQPYSNQIEYSGLDFSEEGPFTGSVIQSLVKEFPHVQKLSYNDAVEAADIIISTRNIDSLKDYLAQNQFRYKLSRSGQAFDQQKIDGMNDQFSIITQ